MATKTVSVWERARPNPPEVGANFFSKLTFHWIGRVLRNGYKRPLNANDIPLINPARSAHHVLADTVQARLHSNRARGDKFPLWGALYATFKREFWIGGACRGVADVLLVTTPYTLRYLIQFTMDSHAAGLGGYAGPPISHGIGYLVGISAMLVIQTLAHNHFMYLMGVIGGQSRAVLVSAIFDKSMRISGRGSLDNPPELGKGKGKKGAAKGKKDADGKEHTVGGLTNFMSVDCARIDRSTTAIHMLWTAPMALIIAVALLIANLGVSALAGLGLLLLGFGVLIIAVGILFQQRKAIDAITSSRVSLIHEVLGAVQLVKYLAWEDGFVRRIAAIRAHETHRLHRFQAVRNVVAAVSQSLPIVTAMVSFITYAKITDDGLSPAAVFSSVALFASLRMPLVYLPLCLQGCSDSWAALLRVQRYLGAEEPEGHAYDAGLGVALEVRGAEFVWKSGSADEPLAAASAAAAAVADNGAEPQTPVDGVSVRLFEDGDKDQQTKSDFQLERLNFDLHRGELVAVIGSVGAGKTSLLSALMGDMTKTAGSVAWGERYAICAQQAWVYNATVRDNIVFGQPFDGERYDDVLRACSLERDMQLLAYGDSTVVGERGVVLSGGQKQRISLARAMYSRARVLLLDDSLSAVDANVGRDIFENAICGELAVTRTRVFCTHDTSILPRCHRVLWMEQGRVRGLDSYDNLMANDPEFARLLERQEAEKDAERRRRNAEKGVDGDDGAESEEEGGDNPQSAAKKPKAKKDSEEDDLMQEEDRAVRSVPWSVYISFVKWSNSMILVACLIPALCLAQGGTVLASLWLAWWSSQRFVELTTDEYIAIYVSLAAAQAIFTYLFGFILATCCTRSSQSMMRKAVLRVLHAPMSFFESTPLGRLTNRFSTDVEVTDYSLTEALRMFLTSLSGVAAIFAIIIVYFHWFAIPAAALVLFLGFLAYYYRTTAREVKRLESTLRSAVFARFIEGLKGASTIRTFGLDLWFGRKLRVALDDVNSASFATYAVQRWLGLRQDGAVVLVVAVMGALVLVERHRQHPAIAGLVLSLMLNAVQVIQVVVREWADVEGSMNAVERLYEYAVQLPQEELRHDDDLLTPNPPSSIELRPQPSHTWLRTGRVEFTNAHLRYRPGIPESLRGVTISIAPGEHAAIVGRTGAGKSSIINALFRMTELSGGSITIDGVDIATLPLASLRGALSIIPQDANLFSGTVRDNLDPFDALADAQLWAGLRAAAGLHESLALGDVVAHDGANLSQGQRQLLALARVLVRGEANRVLVCDEATAALDAETDDCIQGVLREAFKGRTIICVAHRLRTVLWYDRVYVMDQGRVAEEGSPLELFRRVGGVFRGMCVKNGVTEEMVVESAKAARGDDT